MEIPILAYAAGFAALLPVGAGLLRIRSLDGRMKILLVMFAIGAINVSLEFILAFQGIRNLFLAHFYLLIEFLFFIWVCSLWVEKPERNVLRVLFILFIVFWIVSHLFFESFDSPAYYTSFLSKVLYSGICIMLLHKFSAASERTILLDPRFWILAGLLLFATGGIMFSFLRSIIDTLPLDGLLLAYSIHWIISIVTNLMYAIGFLCKPQLQSSGGQLELAR